MPTTGQPTAWLVWCGEEADSGVWSPGQAGTGRLPRLDVVLMLLNKDLVGLCACLCLSNLDSCPFPSVRSVPVIQPSWFLEVASS